MLGNYYVYIMTNPLNRVLYTGVTNDLERRTSEHRQKSASSFTSKYNAIKLVYYEHGFDIEGEIAREKQIKGWLRKRKIDLINTMNPNWEDLSS